MSRPRSRSMTDALRMLSQGQEVVLDVPRLAQDGRTEIDSFLEKLPRLEEADLVALEQKDASCPICLTPFLAILAEEEMATAMESPAHPAEELGITRLTQTCGHIFCRKDIRDWVERGRNSCPTCRHPLMDGAQGDPNLGDISQMLDEILMGAGREGLLGTAFRAQSGDGEAHPDFEEFVIHDDYARMFS